MSAGASRVSVKNMKVCLYIPCRNGSATLPEVFAAVSQQTRAPDLLLLVNDQSTDDTARLAQSAGWSVVHTSSERNGLAVARNLAAAEAASKGCDILAGLDADAVPRPNYVETLTTFYTTNPSVSGTCGNMIERFSSSPSDLWRAVFMRQHWGDVPLDNPPILFGSSAAHRVAVLHRVGGFNEALRTNFEDTELTQRLLHAGYRLAYVPAAASEHLKRDTADSVLKMFWNWYRPGAEMAGHFKDVNSWLRLRHPWIWQDYINRSAAGLTFPGLTAITEALPWAQILRDVHLLGTQSGTLVDLQPVVEIAAELHATHGYEDSFIDWLRCRLVNIVHECHGRETLHPQVQAAIRESADRMLPRRGFWDALEKSMRCVAPATNPSA